MRNQNLFSTLLRKSSHLNIAMKVLAGIALVLMISGCASSGGTAPLEPTGSNVGRISQCKSGDQQISSSRQCLQDDAACYQLNNGDWCTGERGNTCPAGSIELPAGLACPAGKRCFSVGESLQCTIS